MASYVLGFKTDGGIPLFSRGKGNIASLPFPVSGSLNGVHLFCASNAAQLQSATTSDARIVWKSYHKSVTLILVTHDEDNNGWLLGQLLDLIFGAVVLLLGLDDIVSMRNIERTKKDIRVCFALIDQILEFNESSFVSALTLSSQTIAASENAILQTHLDGFAEAAQSQFGCLFVNGAVAVATKKWWELSAIEKVLLQHLVVGTTSSQSTFGETAVFLPQMSPSVPHRLLVFSLMPGIYVAVICGPNPTLDAVTQRVEGFWRPGFDSLVNLKSKDFVDVVKLDKNVIGILVINTTKHSCLLCTCPQRHPASRNPGNADNARDYNQILFSVYRRTVGSIWPPPPLPDFNASTIHGEPTALCSLSQNHPVTDTYMCADGFKSYAFQTAVHRVFVLYHESMPTYAMRSTSHKMLQALLRDKWTTV